MFKKLAFYLSFERIPIILLGSFAFTPKNYKATTHPSLEISGTQSIISFTTQNLDNTKTTRLNPFNAFHIWRRIIKLIYFY